MLRNYWSLLDRIVDSDVLSLFLKLLHLQHPDFGHVLHVRAGTGPALVFFVEFDVSEWFTLRQIRGQLVDFFPFLISVDLGEHHVIFICALDDV